MLLLYLNRLCQTHPPQSKFTFHYASTLSYNTTVDKLVSDKFTFHYASTLSPADLLPTIIYISFTFHYASTLSKKWKSGTSAWRFIYIPLCFYFITPVLARWHTLFSIYIPLCFYFIHAQLRRAFLSMKFTFHYASTLSAESIRQVGAVINLHSTMLLLYLITLLRLDI